MPYLQSLKSWTISECSEGQFFDTIVLQIPGGKKKTVIRRAKKFEWSLKSRPIIRVTGHTGPIIF